MRVYNSAGDVIGGSDASQCSVMYFDIGNLVPGAYIVTINAIRQNGQTYNYSEAFTVIKI